VLDVSDLTLSYGAEPVLEGANLRVDAGQFVSLVGPSGSGKSSRLRAIMGLLRPSAGTVTCDLDRRDMGILFQDDALLPWRTALDNVALGLRIRGKPRPHAHDEAEAWLDRLGLVGFGQRFPRALSGGQRKRVALRRCWRLGRAFC
jgi:NitT/TauT family transport system ATP-binding protein